MTSAQEAAADAIRLHHFNTDENYPGAGKWCACGFSVGWVGGAHAGERRDHVARMILEALTTPTKKPCAKCDELGFIRADDADKDCPDCTDGFVASPAPIEGLLEQVGWWDDDEEWFHHMGISEEIWKQYQMLPLFRLPSKVREG